MKEAYLYAFYFKRRESDTTENGYLHHGIIKAENEKEALGKALDKAWPDGNGWVLTNKNVIKATGYVFKGEQPDD